MQQKSCGRRAALVLGAEPFILWRPLLCGLARLERLPFTLPEGQVIYVAFGTCSIQTTSRDRVGK
jgi:hypothetical protein